jgi:UDP-N-acetylmuramate--alanine ligase
MGKKLHVHFMGIGGSGMAPIAVIAKKSGFEVSGCDFNEASYYSNVLLDNGIDIQVGHSIDHLDGVDILAVTPAIFDINPNHPEIVEGKRRNILMTWQEFMGKYLHKDKFLVAVSGTHGKSTTTVLMGLALEAGGLNPIVEAGTIYKPWGGGFRIADSKYFVCEADEFNCNFLNYSPSIIIINNIEMDHPEFFRNFDDFKNAFKSFIKNMKHSGILIVNEESQGIRDVLIDMKAWLQEKNIKVIGYYIKDKFDFPFSLEYKAEIKNYKEEAIEFDISGSNYQESFKLGILGEHNVSNSLGVLSAALELGVNIETLKRVFESYRGIGRRTELIGEVRGVKVFDDYGHHPTAIATTLAAFRNSYPNKTIYAIVEPHQISRLKMFFEEFAEALNKADKVIITKTFVGREIHKNIEPVNLDLLVNKIDTGKAVYIEDFKNVADMIASKAKEGDIAIIFGAGESHKLTKLIVQTLKF